MDKIFSYQQKGTIWIMGHYKTRSRHSNISSYPNDHTHQTKVCGETIHPIIDAFLIQTPVNLGFVLLCNKFLGGKKKKKFFKSFPRHNRVCFLSRFPPIIRRLEQSKTLSMRMFGLDIRARLLQERAVLRNVCATYVAPLAGSRQTSFQKMFNRSKAICFVFLGFSKLIPGSMMESFYRETAYFF